MAASTPRRQGKSDEWWTPRHILDDLGPFDTDPCSPGDAWPTARRQYTIADDGLTQPWTSMVWLNPPYSDPAPWLQRLAWHNMGIALVFARCETKWWFDWVWPHASALLFLKGRVSFVNGVTGEPSKPGHNAGGPSVLVAYGARAAIRLISSDLPGAFMSSEFGSYATGGAYESADH